MNKPVLLITGAASGIARHFAGSNREKFCLVATDIDDTPMLSLQLDTPEEAALTFSGPLKPMTVEDVEKAIWKAMKAKPMELTLPLSRGWLAKLGAVLPGMAPWLHQSLRRKGLNNIERIKNKSSWKKPS